MKSERLKALKEAIVRTRVSEDVEDGAVHQHGWLSVARDQESANFQHPTQHGHTIRVDKKTGRWIHKIDGQTVASGPSETLPQHLETFHRKLPESRSEEIVRRLLEIKTDTPDHARHRGEHHRLMQQYHSQMATHAYNLSLKAQDQGDTAADTYWSKKYDYHIRKADRHGTAYDAASNRYDRMTEATD